MKIWLWIIFLSIISIYNTVYGFLPKTLQDRRSIKFIGIAVASILVLYGIYQMTTSYLSHSYAIVSESGKLEKSRNFPWSVTKESDKGEIVYIINECRIDVSLIDVTPIDKAASIEKYMAIHGAAIKFVGSGFGNPVIAVRFKVEIRK